MKPIKVLSLVAVAAATMMAFAGNTSATVVTSSGSVYTSTIQAASENGHISLHGSNGVTTECAGTIGGTVEKHGAAVTAEDTELSSLAFPNCANGYAFHVLKRGGLIAHAAGGGDAILTSTGAQIQATANTIFGAISCVYTTNSTSLGVLTGSNTTKGEATLDLTGTIPRTGGSSICGSTGVWTGSYVINTPSNLNID